MGNIALLSVLVATKNREKYAYELVRQVLSIEKDNIELVINDNSNSNDLEKMLEEFNGDARLVYNYVAEEISVIENYSRAIGYASGKYVCALGDDDGINPEIMDIVEWADKNDIEAIKPGLELIYYWPNSGVRIKNFEDNGILRISNINGSINIGDTNEELKTLLRDGCQNYFEKKLVKFYHGIVKREYFEVIKQKTGRYIGGLSPDIYTSVSLSLLIDRVVEIDYPLTIAGICKASTSADSATGKHTGSLKDAPHFIGQPNYEWSKEMPEIYSVPTIWGDSAIHAFTENKKEMMSYFNMHFSVARLLLMVKEYRHEILKHYISIEKISLNGFLKILGGLTYFSYRYVITNIKKVLERSANRTLFYTEINDISNALIVFKKFQNENNVNITEVIKKLEMKKELISNA